MKRYFLVDFENVADAGLNGFFELTAEDTVDIFYTQKNNRISMDFFTSFLERGSAAALSLRKVAAGNQALDLQLASFLGSLIAGSREECEYCIISKDKGFSCLPAFWDNQKGSGCVRQAGSIREALSGNAREAQTPHPVQPEPKAAPQPQPKPAVQPQPKPAPQPRPLPKPQPAAVRPAPESAKPAAAEEEKPAPAASEEKPAPTPQEEKPAPAAPEGEKAAPAAPEGEKPKQAAQPNEKTVLNVRVQQALSKAKCDTQVISQTASLIAKAYGDPKIKQLVYRDLIKRYGQKQGLEVYNLVKPLL